MPSLNSCPSSRGSSGRPIPRAVTWLTRLRGLDVFRSNGVIGTVNGIHRVDSLQAIVRDILDINDLDGDVLATVLKLVLELREVLGALKVKGALANANLVAGTATGLFERIVNTHAGKLMLQIDDGLLIFPVGLDNQALDGATDHAEGTGLLLDNTEPLLALQATTLPLLIAQIDRLIRDRQLSAELSHLLAHGKHQRVETGTRHSGHGKEHMAIVERRTLKVGNLVGRARRIALVGDNDLRTLRKLGTILLELTLMMR